MARTFSAQDARKLIQEHRSLQAKLCQVLDLPGKEREAIAAAAKALQTAEALEILRTVPVEELNRDKLGLRVRALREAGFENIAQVFTASAAELASVNGISPEGARTIKRIAQEMADHTAETVRIRLSTDQKTPSASALVRQLSAYRQIRPYTDACTHFSAAEKEVPGLLTDLEPATKSIGWLFTGSGKRERAERAYGRLTELSRGAYGSGVRGSYDKIAAILRNTTDEAAWADFEQNSIRFFNILEEICPGLIGGSDAVYGLPEDLAREISEEECFPDGLLCELRRYQEWGVKYILHQERVLLGDEMGLGKTVQAIAAMVSLRNTGATHFLVVCPASVLTNWVREIQSKSRLSVTRIHGEGRKEALRSWLKSGGAAVTTYETTGHLLLPEGFRLGLLVADEAHYIKNPAARRTQNVKRLSEAADRLLFMTGTALENRVDEMVALIRLLNPAVAEQVSGMEYMASAPQFRLKVAPVYYRRKREDVLAELPEMIESREWCDLEPAEEAVYEADVLEGRYAQARRVSWTAPDPAHSSKARRMRELIDEAAEDGRKIIVFSFFLETLRRITELLGDRCLQPINGSVPPARRQEILDEFEKAPAGTVLAAQIQSGGTGLNIQAASVVIICEPQFKPSTENQAISRAYRMGQTRNVLVFRLLCDETIDERITDLLAEKQAIFDAFADKSEAARQSLELDEKSFGSLIQDEIERIKKKQETERKPVLNTNEPTEHTDTQGDDTP
ncbi:MAG: DEAD/DEAH box helicase [Lachnospiraceae bacterium]|nr:DEAD/DEAH box helicase [Lachnospiraceae bacterium]